MAQFTVQKENERRKDEAFVVRNENNRFQAAFAYRSDAELFATMMGCDSCKQDVSDHARIKRLGRKGNDDGGVLRQALEGIAHRLKTPTDHRCSRA